MNPETDEGMFDVAAKTITGSLEVMEPTRDSKFESMPAKMVDGALGAIFDAVGNQPSKIGGKKAVLALTGIAFALSACSQNVGVSATSDGGGGQDGGTVTAVHTGVATTESPDFTATPEITATPEAQFTICPSDKMLTCELDRVDLESGKYWEWLNTLSEPFDPEKINDALMVDFLGELIYDPRTAPNFEVDGSAPFRRDVTSGYLELTDTQGLVHKYLVLPIEYYDEKHPNKNPWVVTVYPLFYPGYNYSDAELLHVVEVWQNEMNTTPILTSAIVPQNKLEDPLVAKTFEKYPDMSERFVRFLGGDDLSALSAPGIVLLTKIGSSDGPIYR